MIALTDLEIYKPVFNITEKNNMLEHYNFPVEKSGGV